MRQSSLVYVIKDRTEARLLSAKSHIRRDHKTIVVEDEAGLGIKLVIAGQAVNAVACKL